MASNFPIYNVVATTANTEYSQQLDRGVSYFEIRARQLADLKVAFISGNSGTLYFTIPAGSTWYTREKIPDGTTVTLYFQSPSANVDVEIIAAY